MTHAVRSLVLVAVAIVAVQAIGPAQAGNVGPRRPIDSELLAGYAGPGGDTGFQATFTVPEFRCKSDETSSMLTAILANSTNDENSAQTVHGGGGIFLTCQGGTAAVSSALYDHTGRPAEAGSVKVGDKIRVTYESNKDAAQASSILENLTQDYVTVTGPFDYVPTTDFQVGDLALTTDGEVTGPVPAAGAISFRNVTVDGNKIRKRSALIRYRLVDAAGSPVRTPSRIEGAGFTIRPRGSV